MKVLVIEDNDVNLILMQSILRHNGCESISAKTGAAGIEMTLRHRPDLVFLDLGLPDMDGVEVARQIRKELGESVPITAVTAHAFQEYRDLAAEAGCQHFITKPVSLQSIESIIQKYKN